jgi:RHS repeat-associated protein
MLIWMNLWFGQRGYSFHDFHNGATLANGGQYTSSESKVLNFTATYNQKYDEDLTYDIRGNILTLQRKTANGAGMTPIDNLSYSYNAGTNRLNTISDASSNAAGFNLNGATVGYGYDLNGNYFTDPYKKITSSKYYFNNLPKDIVVSGGATNGTIRFTYDASGMKLRKEVFNTSNVSQRKQDYIGRIEYVNNVIEAIYTSEGRAVWVPATSSWRYEYNITDHLGNVRAVISDLNNNSVLDIASREIINQNAYYPFGMWMNNSALANNTSTPDTKYQYNGKEFNADLGLNLLDYGGGWYDASSARFSSVDPLTDKFPFQSGYLYAGNNPIRFIDFKGKFKLPANIAERFPHFASYVKNNISEITKSEAIMNALQNSAGLSREQIQKDIQNESGPIINIGTLPKGTAGLFTGKNGMTGESSFTLNVEMVQKFENAMNNPNLTDDARQSSLLGIVSTLLHEYVHTATGGKNFEENEKGIQFEEEAYGQNVDALDINASYQVLREKTTGDLVNPSNHRKVIQSDDSKIDRSVIPTLPKKN